MNAVEPLHDLEGVGHAHYYPSHEQKMTEFQGHAIDIENFNYYY